METSETTKTASQINRDEVVTFDFRGDHLGECKVWDCYPIGTPREYAVPMVQMVLVDADDRHHYRKVAANTPFATK